MKKNSSFQLKSGNNLGASATKLMKQSPARAEEKPKPKLIQNIEKAVSSEQAKLEGKIKGFFGNLKKGFETAKKKRKAQSDQTTMNIKNIGKVVKHELTKPTGTAKPTAGKGGTKGMQEKAKKFKFF